MVYSRMDMNDKDLPQYIELRNAYLFAAPILCDRPSVQGTFISFSLSAYRFLFIYIYFYIFAY